MNTFIYCLLQEAFILKETLENFNIKTKSLAIIKELEGGEGQLRDRAMALILPSS